MTGSFCAGCFLEALLNMPMKPDDFGLTRIGSGALSAADGVQPAFDKDEVTLGLQGMNLLGIADHKALQHKIRFFPGPVQTHNVHAQHQFRDVDSGFNDFFVGFAHGQYSVFPMSCA